MIVRVEISGDAALVFDDERGARLAEIGAAAVRKRFRPEEQGERVTAWFEATMEDGVLEIGERCVPSKRNN